MLSSETKQVGRYEYKVTKFPTRKGLEVFEKLLEVVGEPLALFMRDGGEETGQEELDDAEALSKALGLFAKNVQGGKLFWFADQFMPHSSVTIDGTEKPLKPIFELHFSGEYGELMGWLLFCLEVNYKSFFDGLGGVKDQAAGLTQTQ